MAGRTQIYKRSAFGVPHVFFFVDSPALDVR